MNILAPPPTQRLIFQDFETYYNSKDGYSLSAKGMTPANYILDERYETIMCAVKEQGNGNGYIVDGPDYAKWIADAKPTAADTTTVTFNALFDNAIMAWRYGYVPGRMLDSMGMARALRGHELSRNSLSFVSKALGVGEKKETIIKVDGMTRQMIKDAGLWDEFCDYALTDNVLSEAIFMNLLPFFPASERRVMDLVIRTTIIPAFHVDRVVLCDHIDATRAAKDKLLADSGVSKDELMSADKFKAALSALGVPIQMKEGKRGPIPAISKTDGFMEELLEHEDPKVQALAAARVGHKSTIEETRAIKYLSISCLPWARYRDGDKAALPMPLRYGAAHTHRLGGDWGMNVQNLGRQSPIRRALIAPPGYAVVDADLSQIEARICAWICGQTDAVEAFAAKKDLYSMLATEIFGRPINRKLDTDKVEGFIGKTGTLGLGFGCGKLKFYDMVLKLARLMGLDLGTMWTEELAAQSVTTYRNKNAMIVNGWNRLDAIIPAIWLSGNGTANFGPCTISKGCVMLPNGMPMFYGNPHSTMATDEKTQRSKLEYRFKFGRETHLLYGGKLLENIVQALARIIVMNAALRLNDRGYRFVQQAHDALCFLVPHADVDNAKKIVYEEMTRRPSWGQDLPLDCEVKSGPSYGETK